MSRCTAFPSVLVLAAVLFARGAAPARGAPPAPGGPSVDALVATIDGPDADARRVAVVRLKNLDGTNLEAAEKAAGRDGLSPAARDALKAAIPALRYRARRARVAADIEAYDLKSTTEAYEKVGWKGRAWDGLVKEALLLSNRPPENAAPRAEVVAAFKRAVDAGCEDPLILYLYARNEWLAGPADRQAVLARHHRAVVAMRKSAHPAEWRCRAAVRYLEQTGVPDGDALNLCYETLAAAFAENGRSHEENEGFADTVQAALTRQVGAEAAFDRIYPAYAKARPADDPGPHIFRARRLIDAAWEARGEGFAHTVTPDGWQVFRERLADARAALEKAWKTDPDNTRAATLMLKVVLGDTGDKGEMEMWFRRAMAAGPDNRAACAGKLWFLYPRWHGSHAEMLAFGRQCLASQNWWGPLPTILVDAHVAVSEEMNDPKAYLAQPQVWDDIEAVHGSFLEVFPDSPRAAWHRSKLAKWACDCGQWARAKQLFAEIGDKPDPTVFPSPAVYNYYKRKADRIVAGAKQV